MALDLGCGRGHIGKQVTKVCSYHKDCSFTRRGMGGDYCSGTGSQGPHSQILMTGGGGGVQQRFIFYTQKDHNFRIGLPKKITTFFSIPKKIP